MIKFNKPRYKLYSRLLEDIRNEFRIAKFNNFKWNRLKRKLRFEFKWIFSKYRRKRSKRFLRNVLPCHIKIFDHFYYNYAKIYAGPRKKVISPKNDTSVFSFENQKRFKNSFKYSLFNKQRVCYYYNIQDHKLKKLVRKTYKAGEKSSAFICLLEKRLDNILYKAGFVLNFRQSRQLIIHRKVLVNNKVQSKIEYLLKAGDIVELNIPLYLALKLLRRRSKRIYTVSRKNKNKNKKYFKLLHTKFLNNYSYFMLFSVKQVKFITKSKKKNYNAQKKALIRKKFRKQKMRKKRFLSN